MNQCKILIKFEEKNTPRTRNKKGRITLHWQLWMRLSSCSAGMKWIPSQAPHKPGTVVHVCSASSPEVDIRGHRVQGHFHLYSKSGL